MASEERLGDVLRKLGRLGCECEQQRRRPTHWKVTRMVRGAVCVTGFATTRGARHVKPSYVRQLRQRLHISAEDSDDA